MSHLHPNSAQSKPSEFASTSLDKCMHRTLIKMNRCVGQCQQFSHHSWKQDVSCMPYDSLLNDAKATFFGLIHEFKFLLCWPETTTNHSKADQMGQLFLRGMPSVTSSLWAGRKKINPFFPVCWEQQDSSKHESALPSFLCTAMFRITLDLPLSALSNFSYLPSHDWIFFFSLYHIHSGWVTPIVQYAQSMSSLIR